jgi:hypothetical protein
MATNIFEYMGGKWYLIHHHGSPIMKWFLLIVVGWLLLVVGEQ